MPRLVRSAVIGLGIAGALSCTPRANVGAQSPSPPLPAVSGAAMDAHLKYLADDLLEGRAPATRGGELAARYIAAQFEALGLAPGAADGSYYQPVTLVGLMPRPAMRWGGAGTPGSLRYLDDFVAWSERPSAAVSAKGEVVFVGYGIRAPEWKWDDYKDVDLRGKLLLMLVNDPGMQDSTIFQGRTLTYYGRWTYKLEEAGRRGAMGAILIHTTESATYPWDVVRGSWSVEQFMLDGARGTGLECAGWVTEQAARAVLRDARLDFDSLVRSAARRSFRPVRTGIQAEISIASKLRRVPSSNVVARVSGENPVLRSQVVLVTAHYDHKGIGPPVNGDSIYNGAEDNASGVAAMLGLAQALMHDPAPRKRSVLFIATTAEESGLLGSQAYVEKPLAPLSGTAAVVNVDVANVRGATRDIAVLGGDRSTLGTLFKDAAARESLTATGDPDPTRGSFFRSDHFPFARAGVPAISVESGVEFVGRPVGWGEQQSRMYNEQRYHEPTDEYRSDFRYEGMVQEVRVVLQLIRALASDSSLPKWLPGSEFQRTP